MKRTTRAITTALVLTLALALGACGDDGGTSLSADTSSDHNDADVTFASAMVPHHQQAVQMARMASMHAESTEVKDLAQRIEKAQGPEIETMQG